MSKLHIHLDDVSAVADNPDQSDFDRWARVLDDQFKGEASLCLKLVSPAEMAELNQQFRGKQGATNVLSFPVDGPELEWHATDGGERFLGDIAICADLVQEESEQQGKNNRAHWTHLFFHGVLHLLGYDHESDEDAERMEELETSLLAKLQIAPPYQENAQASAG